MRREHCCDAACYVALQCNLTHLRDVPRGGSLATRIANPKETEMFENLKVRIAKRARYRRMIDEINSLTTRDLADFNGNRADMLSAAYDDVYGR